MADTSFWHCAKSSNQTYLFIANTPYFLRENKNKLLFDFKMFLFDTLLYIWVSYIISVSFLKSKSTLNYSKSSAYVYSLFSQNDANTIIWKLQVSGGQYSVLQLNKTCPTIFFEIQSSNILETVFLSYSLVSSHSQINDSSLTIGSHISLLEYIVRVISSAVWAVNYELGIIVHEFSNNFCRIV